MADAGRGASDHSNGDGGGGPLPDMLERVRRMKNTLGLPRLKFSHPDAFFDGLNAEAGDKLLTVRPRTAVGNSILPKLTAPANRASRNTQQWVGELYLELHRGTYTSQAFVKAGNRHMEARLRETEALCLLALVHGGSGYQYGRAPALWRCGPV